MNMKRNLTILALSLIPLVTSAEDNASATESANNQYQECVAVSLYTIQGRELNSAIENNRKVKQTSLIPKGWTVIGATTKTENEIITPYVVICH